MIGGAEASAHSATPTNLSPEPQAPYRTPPPSRPAVHASARGADWQDVVRHPLVLRVQEAVDGTIVHVRRAVVTAPPVAAESATEVEEEA